MINTKQNKKWINKKCWRKKDVNHNHEIGTLDNGACNSSKTSHIFRILKNLTLVIQYDWIRENKSSENRYKWVLSLYEIWNRLTDQHFIGCM